MLGEVGTGLRAELTSLAARVDALQSSWQGAAASAFEGGWLEWESGARAVIGALATMSALLRASGAGYASGERGSVGAVLASARRL